MFCLAHLASDAPSKQDVVVGTLGASSALAGLILVFLGTVISMREKLAPDAPSQSGTPHRKAVAGILTAFFIGLIGAALSLAWLMTDGGDLLYGVLVTMFFVQLITILGVALYTTYRVLLV